MNCVFERILILGSTVLASFSLLLSLMQLRAKNKCFGGIPVLGSTASERKIKTPILIFDYVLRYHAGIDAS